VEKEVEGVERQGRREVKNSGETGGRRIEGGWGR
jgi:hypothetical protein